jgi:threonine aldolase
MRRAMAEAEVGDDTYGEDPTVRLLEEETAALLGKEAALFVPSGCMGNQIAVAVHTKPGQGIVLDHLSHVAMVEAQAVTEFLGCRLMTVKAERGLLHRGLVERGFADAKRAGVAIGLVEVENTHNWSSGAVYSLPLLESIASDAAARGVPVHMDGARLWNATAATGTSLATFAGHAQSVMVCYSKGLGAPVGSAVAGSRAFLEKGRAARKTFGGSMRQAGIVAAAALHAVRHHRERLVEDHRRAKRLAEAFAEIQGLRLCHVEIPTNILVADTGGDETVRDAFLRAVAAEGVLLGPAAGGPGRFRAVTHLDVDDAGIERAIAAVRAASASVLARAARP